MSKRKSYQLPPGVRFVTDAEREARRTAKSATAGADRTLAKAEHDGWALKLPKIRRRRRRRRPPAGIFRMPR